ncbi:TIGR03084 family metal-binding protein [Rhodococcus sp. UNC363MFTsu5.1]|uniref:TIGR03084 family metal-binding protein n=1 Tax=Rhodococcus sp. UNC363MFTsu5.1 TaxID=1449069 RepID=UPI000487F73A|nr:TIGR03084 family metal-binding protein [Rhodococcus sp. UNC363MFTsu5.1]
MADLSTTISDLQAEGEQLDALVASLTDEEWASPTPAKGWSIAHQIGHLAWTDRASLMAVTDPEAFAESLTAAWKNPLGFVDEAAEVEAARPPAELLADWRAGRTALAEALAAVPSGTKLPWYGPPMSAMSMATARLMETWAHGQDVAAALGVDAPPTNRLRSIAHLGVRTRDFAYAVNELTPPAEEFRFELTAPEGDEVWTWGPEDAAQRVTGPAADFCLLVTQRANPADLDLTAVGPDATAWIAIAQVFAGPPGAGRDPKVDA